VFASLTLGRHSLGAHFHEIIQGRGKSFSYTVTGRGPDEGGTTTISTTLVPLSLIFDANTDKAGKKRMISAASDVAKVVQSPIFQKFAFATGNTQYADAVQRAEFYHQAAGKHWVKGHVEIQNARPKD
jgi:chitinase